MSLQHAWDTRLHNIMFSHGWWHPWSPRLLPQRQAGASKPDRKSRNADFPCTWPCAPCMPLQLVRCIMVVPAIGMIHPAKLYAKICLQENANRSDALPPSQGGKYVGFGSAGPAPARKQGANGAYLDDVGGYLSKGFTQLSTAAGRNSRGTVVCGICISCLNHPGSILWLSTSRCLNAWFALTPHLWWFCTPITADDSPAGGHCWGGTSQHAIAEM